jgi:hypothetical protein
VFRPRPVGEFYIRENHLRAAGVVFDDGSADLSAGSSCGSHRPQSKSYPALNVHRKVNLLQDQHKELSFQQPDSAHAVDATGFSTPELSASLFARDITIPLEGVSSASRREKLAS